MEIGRPQRGYNKDTMRMQEGYNEVITRTQVEIRRLQRGYNEDTGRNTKGDTMRIGVISTIISKREAV